MIKDMKLGTLNGSYMPKIRVIVNTMDFVPKNKADFKVSDQKEMIMLAGNIKQKSKSGAL
jgi:hypothetical protein